MGAWPAIQPHKISYALGLLWLTPPPPPGCSPALPSVPSADICSWLEWRRRDIRGPGNLGDQHSNLVDVAPAPLLMRLKGTVDRVASNVGMGSRVAVRRTVTAPAVPTFETDPQVTPGFYRGQAVLTTIHRARSLRKFDIGVMSERDHPYDRGSGSGSPHGANAWFISVPTEQSQQAKGEGSISRHRHAPAVRRGPTGVYRQVEPHRRPPSRRVPRVPEG
jgi:hypothetical protein